MPPIWKEMSLYLDNKNFTDKQLLLISANPIWAQNRTESLHIDFENAAVSDVSMIDFLKKSLAKMSNLRNFDLRLWKTQITDLSIQAFALHSLPNFSNLTELCLFF